MSVKRAILLVLLASFCLSSMAVPATINYSGRLVSPAGIPVTESTAVAFSFYSVPVDGDAVEGYEFEITVTPNSDGLYSVAIGGDTGVGGPVPAIIFDEPQVYLNVQVGGEDLTPRAAIASVGYAFRADEATTAAKALGLAGGAYIMVEAGGSDTENGQALLDAYATARELRPGGQDLSASNRAVVLVVPGRYDLTTQALVLDTEFVDLVGLTSSRESQRIFGATNGDGTGVLMQTANDVRINNLVVECTRSIGSLFLTPAHPAAYYPDQPVSDKTVIKNCRFLANRLHVWSMRIGVEYAGTYIDCVGANLSFGADGIASGEFINCIGESSSFAGSGGVASGTFTGCIGGQSSFGAVSGTGSGVFINCRGGRYAFGGFNGIANGTFINCICERDSFGGFTNGGKFRYCEGGIDSFGDAAGDFVYCIKNGAPGP